MLEFIKMYWLESLFATLIAALGIAFRKLWSRVKSEVDEQRLMRKGILAILHDRLFQACTHHIEIGWCSVNEMKNIGKLYKSYNELGGNSTGTELYHRVCKLPTTKTTKE